MFEAIKCQSTEFYDLASHFDTFKIQAVALTLTFKQRKNEKPFFYREIE